MEKLDLQPNLAMMENMEFEEKVNIDDLVLPSKPMKSVEIKINEIKQEPIIEEEKQYVYLESDYEAGNHFKLKVEENILKLCEELNKEKSEDSTMDFSLRISLKIRQFVEKIAEFDHEIKPFSCKFCDKSFAQVHEVKEHIRIHNSITEVEDLKNHVKSLKTQVKELEVKLKTSQSKLASQTRLKNKFKNKADVVRTQEIPETKVDQEGVKDILEQRKTTNQLEEKTCDKLKTRNMLTCDTCLKIFKNKNGLYQHRLTHVEPPNKKKRKISQTKKEKKYACLF